MDDRASVVSASTYGGMENLDLDSIATGTISQSCGVIILYLQVILYTIAS